MGLKWKQRALAAMISAGLWTSGGMFADNAAFGKDIPAGAVEQSIYEAAPGTTSLYKQTSFFDSICDSCAAAESTVCDSCDSCCGWCNIGDPWKLSKEDGFDYGGWVDLGWQNAPDGAFTSAAEADKFNLNQLYLYALKAADGSEGWDWGYRFDTMYGVDGNDAQSFGNNPGVWDFANGFDHGIYEIALPQAYLELAHCDFSVKAGHFYTIIGYEVVTTPDNFFYSKQLTFWNSEPFTHTGAVASYKLSDSLTVTGGWTLGWDTGFDQFNGGSNGLYGLTWAVNDDTNVIFTGGVGNFGWRNKGVINSLIVSRSWTDKISTVTQFDVLGTNNPVDFQINGVARNSTGLINYLFYTINDCMKIGLRREWYKADGTSYYTSTVGLNFRTHANYMIRPEIRYNNSPGDPNPVFNKVIYGVDVLAKF